MINRKFFFDQCRATLFTGRLNKSQVDGLTCILDEWETSHRTQDDRWLAYALGTTFHETGFTMQPVRERGGAAYFTRMYDPSSSDPRRSALARKMKARPGDGAVFYGRGFVQLTWRVNYEAMGSTFGADLTSAATAADRVMEPLLAAKIMFRGMEKGSFTGKKLEDFFSASKEDWKNARRIINGNDCDEAIAVYAKKFYGALSYTTG